MTWVEWATLAGLIILLPVLATIPVEACCYRPKRPLRHLLEWHHGYLAGLVFVWDNPWWQGWWFLFIVDDLPLQHVWHYIKPSHRSIMHWIAAKTWYPWRANREAKRRGLLPRQ